MVGWPYSFALYKLETSSEWEVLILFHMSEINISLSINYILIKLKKKNGMYFNSYCQRNIHEWSVKDLLFQLELPVSGHI